MPQTKHLYFGPHLHAALTCLRAGYPKKAASWMWRDIGESDNYEPGDNPVPESLRIVDHCGNTAIEYADAATWNAGVSGDGI